MEIWKKQPRDPLWKLPVSMLIFWSVICHLAFGCCWDIWRHSRVFENRQFMRIDFQSKESHLLYWEPLMELWVLIFYYSVTAPNCGENTHTHTHTHTHTPSHSALKLQCWLFQNITHLQGITRGMPSSSVNGISQGRILKWVDISFSRRSSQPRDQTFVSCKSPALADRFFTCQPLGNIFMYLHSQLCLIFKKWKDKKDVHRSTVHNSQNMEAT